MVESKLLAIINWWLKYKKKFDLQSYTISITSYLGSSSEKSWFPIVLGGISMAVAGASVYYAM